MPGNPQTSTASILIVRLGAMGDVLHAMPAVAAIRKTCPQARIGWVIEQRWSELLVSQDDGSAATIGDNSLIDSLHTVDTRAWRKNLLHQETWRDIRRSVGLIREAKYDVALDFQGAIKSALVAKSSGAAEIYGFSRPRESAAKLWYTSQVNATASHVIDQNMQLASVVTRKQVATERVALPRSMESERWCDETLRRLGLSKFAVLNPGSGWGAKCWPPDRYSEVAKRLKSSGILSVINHGPGEESLAQAVAARSEDAATPVACDLKQLIALTRRASLFVGGDTGPMHLAAALKIPSVALFGPTDPARNGPYWEPSVILRDARSVTSYKHVAQADPGLHSISVDTVVAAAAQLLGVPIG